MQPAIHALFWFAAGVIVYAYAGYPALLSLKAWLRPAPPVRKGEGLPHVSVLIIVHNEEQRIEAKLQDCLAFDYPRELLEIVVASDGSHDRTEELVAIFAPQGVRLLPFPGPRGKAAVLNEAVPACRGEILVLCDARQRVASDAVRQLVAHFADPTVGAVSGELHIESHAGSAASEGVGLYWRYEKLIRQLECRLDSTVGVTGALYAVRRSLYEPLDSRTILDDVAVPMAVVRAGYRVLFEPLARAYDRAAASPAKEYGRKVRTLTGNYQLVALRPNLLHPSQNRLLWQFVSHKLLRLVVPWCLLAALVSSGLVAWPPGISLYDAAFWLQVAFYGAAVAGWCLEKLELRLPLLSFPYSFALLNLAAASSLLEFVRGSQTAAWKRAGSPA